MKLKFLKEESLEILKENIKANKDLYLNENNEWIYDFFKGEDPFIEFKDEVNDFELDMSEKIATETDLKNIKIIYENLKFLTESQASDERFWAGLCHDKFYSYMKYRWGNQIIENSDDEENCVGKIKQSYFYGFGKRRSVAWNGIAKLWWIGKLTYDESLKNPYEITEYVAKDLGTTTLYLCSSNFTSNKNIRLGMFKAILEFERKGYRISRNKLKRIMKEINILGGSYLLDFYSEDEIKKKCIEIIKRYIIRQ